MDYVEALARNHRAIGLVERLIQSTKRTHV